MFSLGLILVGFIVGMLGSIVGIGGGTLFVPYFIFVLKMPAEIAVATSLGIVWLSALSGFFAYRKLNLVNNILFTRYSFPAIPAALLAAYLLQVLSPQIFFRVFSVLCLALSMWLIYRGKKKKFEANRMFTDRNYFASTAIAFGVGILSGFLGVGGGFLYVPLFHGWHKLSANASVATSQSILCVTVFITLIGHLIWGHILWPTVFICGFGAILGAQVGARIAIRMPERWITIGLAILLMGVGLEMFFR